MIDLFANDFGVTNRSVNFLLGLVGRALTALLRPAATVTEVFFQRKMGERYFSPLSALAGLGSDDAVYARIQLGVPTASWSVLTLTGAWADLKRGGGRLIRLTGPVS